MSRKNKVNPAHYKVAGRLSADDLARERTRQNLPTRISDERLGPPTWTSSRSAGTGDGSKRARPDEPRRTAAGRRASTTGTTQAKKSAAGTRKKPASGRSAHATSTRNAATGKNKRTSVGSKKSK
jgi:hypothetical protein